MRKKREEEIFAGLGKTTIIIIWVALLIISFVMGYDMGRSKTVNPSVRMAEEYYLTVLGKDKAYIGALVNENSTLGQTYYFYQKFKPMSEIVLRGELVKICRGE